MWGALGLVLSSIVGCLATDVLPEVGVGKGVGVWVLVLVLMWV